MEQPNKFDAEHSCVLERMRSRLSGHPPVLRQSDHEVHDEAVWKRRRLVTMG